jgi:hypothetical protein
MKPMRLLAVAFLVSACSAPSGSQPVTATDAALQEGARKTSTDPDVNPDAAAMAEFKTRVEAYAALHKQLARGDAKQKETDDPASINDRADALTAKVQEARVGAKQGDIFTPEIRPVFRRLLAPKLQGAEGRDVKAVIKDDGPAAGTVPFKVNAKYPEDQPLPTVPANVLITLPPLPEPLEYRIVGQHLLLLDTSTGLIVDYILNAITT